MTGWEKKAGADRRHTLKGHLKTVAIAAVFGMAAYGVVHLMLLIGRLIQ